MPYQRGQFWLRRFRAQAASLCVALAALTKPANAPNFAERALAMLTATGWTTSHRFLFAELRQHLLGWPPSLAPDGRRLTLPAAPAPAGASPHTICLDRRRLFPYAAAHG